MKKLPRARSAFLLISKRQSTAALQDLPVLPGRKVFRKVLECGCALPLLFLPALSLATELPPLDEAVKSKLDVYGEAALRQPNGPSYEFFKALIPPLHYVNADFQHYPLALSAPNTKNKARLISNGCGINVRGHSRSWNDPGMAVLFRVGNDESPFGENLSRLDGPKYADGYLPIVQLRYRHADGAYTQETFASTDPAYASNAVTLSRFTYEEGANLQRLDKARLVARLDTDAPLKLDQGRLLNEKGEVLVWFDKNWEWDPARKLLFVTFNGPLTPVIAVATAPMPAETASPLEKNGFETQRAACIASWKNLLGRGMNIEVPEPVVNNCWRSLVIGTFSLINGDRMHYSAGNQYDKLYEHEGSDTAQSLMIFGYEDDFRRLLVPLLDFTRKGLEQHQAGHKLDTVCKYYWQTRDVNFVNALRPRWQKEVNLLANHRSPTNGLYPREQYCGDIHTLVFSMNSNSKAWRAMHDVAAMLDALGDHPEAARLHKITADFRKDILDAVDKSISPSEPFFLPNALLGEEQPYDFIPATRMGDYWNVMVNTTISSEVFGQNSPMETGMLKYCQQHAGLFMGLLRSTPWPSFWVSRDNLKPLYTQRYVHVLLRRDEPDRALVSFYGMLAAGMTAETFNGGEGCSIQPLDQWGRQFYCPPNSANNAFWLHTFRRLLVQDWDLDEDGAPDTLRLLFATPKRWLEDGKAIKVERAPTAFGPVSIHAQSKLSQNEVVIDVDLPQRNQPKHILLRARVSDGWKVDSVRAGATQLSADKNGTVDISSFRGKQTIHFHVSKTRAKK